MDWGLIATWRDAGVPLNVALRGIDIAMDGFFARQHRGNSKISSLCYCHDSVMTEYASHLDSHIGEAPADGQTASGEKAESTKKNDGFNRTQVIAYLSERIDEIKNLVAKQYPEEAPEGMRRVISRLEEVLKNLQSDGSFDSEALERDFVLIDQLLVTELQACVSPDQRDEWEKEAKKELKVYKKRLPKETYEKIQGNYLRDKVHQKFRIGELSLFRL
jgi:hypothetical protein